MSFVSFTWDALWHFQFIFNILIFLYEHVSSYVYPLATLWCPFQHLMYDLSEFPILEALPSSFSVGNSSLIILSYPWHAFHRGCCFPVPAKHQAECCLMYWAVLQDENILAHQSLAEPSPQGMDCSWIHDREGTSSRYQTGLLTQAACSSPMGLPLFPFLPRHLFFSLASCILRHSV